MEIWNGSQMLGDFNPNKTLPIKIWRLLLNLETLYLLLLCKLSLDSFRPHKVNLFQCLETTSLFGFQDPKCVPPNLFLSCVLQLLFPEGCAYVCYFIVAHSELLLKFGLSNLSGFRNILISASLLFILLRLLPFTK